MCGILGLVGSDAPSVGDDDFIDALDLIRHRGPDGGAIWRDTHALLGHRRLAIVDLAERADQPLHRGRYSVVFNGEIYNHRELRAELQALGQRFATTSDTEVLVAAFDCWGREALARFEGMFAFALWDREARRLTLARDRFGEKPLFVARRAHGLAFASELQPLVRLSPTLPAENAEAIGLFFTLTYVPAPLGALENIAQLEPGCWLEWDAEGSPSQVREGRYYDLDARQFAPSAVAASGAATPSYEDAKAELRRRLADAVRLRVISADVPVATLLSGGIDSSITTTLAAEVSRDPIAAYSLGFPNDPQFDETDHARAVARGLPNVRHHIVPATEERILAFAPQVLDRLGEPFADASILPTSLLCGEIEEKVALGGDAADELFAGYGVYPAIAFGAALPAPVRALLRAVPAHRNPARLRSRALRAAALFHSHLGATTLDSYLSWRAYADPRELKTLGIDTAGLPALRERLGARWGASLAEVQALDVAFNLPNDMLKKVDLAAMLHGLEVRLPFLDSGLVHWALSLPADYRLSGQVRKRILRDTFADRLPRQVLERGKMGFLLPIRQWLRSGSLRDELVARVEASDALDRGAARRLLAEHADGRADHSVLLWSIYVYLRWRERLAHWHTHRASDAHRAEVRHIEVEGVGA